MRTRSSDKSLRWKGFTLVELMIASTVSIAVVIVATQLLLTMVKVEAKNTVNYSMDTQSMHFLTLFPRDAQAAQVVTKLADKRIDLEIPRYGSEVETVKYLIKDDTEEGRYYLQRQEISADGSQENRDLVDNIIEYDLRYYDYSKAVTTDADEVRYVQLYMQLAQTIRGNTHSRKVVTPMVMLRNKTVAN